MNELELAEELASARAELTSVRREALQDFEELRLGYERQLDAQLGLVDALRSATSSAWAAAVTAAVVAGRAEVAAAQATLLRQQRQGADEREAAEQRRMELERELRAARARVHELEAEAV